MRFRATSNDTKNSRRAPSGPRLVVLLPAPMGGRTFAVRRGAQLVGRSYDAHIALDADAVSRWHAWVVWNGARVFVTDAGSDAGTAVNGQPVTMPTPLQDGDVVRLGGALLRYESGEVRARERRSPRRGLLRTRGDIAFAG